MRLASQHIRQRSQMILPFHFNKEVHANGMSYGVSACGYDVRIAETIFLPPQGFVLASTIERFDMPTDLSAEVKDKSSWARQGLQLFNTILEPGWKGILTLELSNHSAEELFFERGMPICQIVFDQLTDHTDRPYQGKYQDQEAGGQPWRQER